MRKFLTYVMGKYVSLPLRNNSPQVNIYIKMRKYFPALNKNGEIFHLYTVVLEKILPKKKNHFSLTQGCKVSQGLRYQCLLSLELFHSN
jgi:hypothetical protein